MKEYIQSKETELFEQWKEKYSTFCIDGIIDINKYLIGKPKIMFLLKEANDFEGNSVDLKDFLLNGAYQRTPTWMNVTRWIHGIKNFERELLWEDIEKKSLFTEKAQEYLSSILIMNIKKYAGSHTTINKDLSLVADQMIKIF